MNYPRVSIVLPTYNQAHYLESALHSVLFQDYPDIEIIVCNHGSTDDTSKIIERVVKEYNTDKVSSIDRMEEDSNGECEFVRKNERRFPPGRIIKVFQAKENIGGTASFNVGFKNTTGIYGTYLVGDDQFAPGFIQTLVENIENSNADYVYADMAVIDDYGRILKVLRKPEYSFERCLAEWYHLGVAKLYRLELHKRAGYYDESIEGANDYDMALRFALNGARFLHVPEVLYFVRNHREDGKDEPAFWKGNGYKRLIDESIACAKRAREAMVKGLVPSCSL